MGIASLTAAGEDFGEFGGDDDLDGLVLRHDWCISFDWKDLRRLKTSINAKRPPDGGLALLFPIVWLALQPRNTCIPES